MALGIPAIGDEKKVLEQLQRLSDCRDDRFGSEFLVFLRELEAGFRCEEDMMECIDFPALCSHREQHARVLSGLHYIVPAMLQGDTGPARQAVRLFPQLYAFHMTTMDLALAVALEGVDTAVRQS